MIRDAAAQVLAGGSLRSIVVNLNTVGVPTVTGRPWSSTVVRRMLTAWRTCGIREHHNEPVAVAVWAPILDRGTTEQLRAVLLAPGRRMNRTRRSYLLTGGLARCALCGANLVARPRADKRRAYVCASGPGFGGCGKIRILADEFEEFVTEAVFEALDHGELAAAVAGAAGRDEHDDPMAAIARSEAELTELAELHGQRAISLQEWLVARRGPEERLQEARKRLSQQAQARAADPLLANCGVLRAAWPELDVNRRRAFLAVVLDRVLVGSALRGRNRFDPDRIDLLWRV